MERKKSRPCFQGRDIVTRGTTLVRLCFTTQAFTSTDASCVILIAEKVRMKHRYPCAVMGAPIIVSTRKMRVVGMQLQGFVRFCFQNSDCSEYLSLYPISAHGTLCNTSRYLLSLFIALSYSILPIQFTISISKNQLFFVLYKDCKGCPKSRAPFRLCDFCG